MHKKCQKCRVVRQYLIVILFAGLIAVISEQLGFSDEITLWSAFAGAVVPLMWLGYRQRSQNEE